MKYRHSKEMVVPDGLSWCSSENKGHIELDMQLNIVQITERRLNNIFEENAKDHVLGELKEVIVHGWPHRVKEQPNQLRPYWSSGWGYYHLSNPMQYSNTALENTSLVTHDSKSFSYRMPLFLMALRISRTFAIHKQLHKHH